VQASYISRKLKVLIKKYGLPPKVHHCLTKISRCKQERLEQTPVIMRAVYHFTQNGCYHVQIMWIAWQRE